MKNFNQIFNDLQPQVVAYLTKLTRNTDLAQDLASEVMVKLWNNMDKFDDNISSMKTWVFVMAKNAAIDNWRKRAIDTTSISEMVDEDGNEFMPLPSYDTPFKEMLNGELKEALDFAINGLPEKYKQFATLHFIEGMTYQEVSDSLDVPLGTVKGNISRLREKLQCSLQSFKLA